MKLIFETKDLGGGVCDCCGSYRGESKTLTTYYPEAPHLHEKLLWERTFDGHMGGESHGLSIPDEVLTWVKEVLEDKLEKDSSEAAFERYKQDNPRSAISPLGYEYFKSGVGAGATVHIELLDGREMQDIKNAIYQAGEEFQLRILVLALKEFMSIECDLEFKES